MDVIKMRDTFGCGFPTAEDEPKTQNTIQNATNSNGIHVSTNGYYGFQPLSQKEPKDDTPEYMEVQITDSGIQFNNFIAPQDRLGGRQEIIVGMRGTDCRKRRWPESGADAPIEDFKKRREMETEPLIPTNKYVNSCQPTHNVPDIPRQLMGHFI